MNVFAASDVAIRHRVFAKKVEVRFGEHFSGTSAAPGTFLGAGSSGDSGRLGWNRALIVCAHRKSEIP